MKIAVSTDGTVVSMHFGRCPFFTIAEIEDGKVIGTNVVPNPGHHPGFLPQFLREQGVSCIIAGGMGQRAQVLFDEAGIRTVMGISGPVANVIEQFASGALQEGQSSCDPGAGRGYGLDKTVCDHENNKEEQ